MNTSTSDNIDHMEVSCFILYLFFDRGGPEPHIT